MLLECVCLCVCARTRAPVTSPSGHPRCPRGPRGCRGCRGCRGPFRLVTHILSRTLLRSPGNDRRAARLRQIDFVIKRSSPNVRCSRITLITLLEGKNLGDYARRDLQRDNYGGKAAMIFSLRTPGLFLRRISSGALASIGGREKPSDRSILDS